MPFPAKHVEKILAAPVRAVGFSASGSSTTVTTAITTALTNAGTGAATMPLQVSANDLAIGVIVSGQSNRVEISDATTKDKLKDDSGNEVYGRITHATGVYTLSYYTLVDGTETEYTFDSSTSIDFEFGYRFDFARYPTDAAIAIPSRNIAQDPKGTGGTAFGERLNVLSTNTLAELTKTPIAASTLELNVNGESFDADSGAFTVSGTTVTWNASTAKLQLDTSDRVYARYFTNE